MARDDERRARAQEDVLVGGLPDVPGIGAAMRLTPGLGVHLRGLADELLVHDFPGATIQRHERELLATAVSAANDCFFCMDSHGAFTQALLERRRADRARAGHRRREVGASEGLDAKMQALLHIARTVQRAPRGLRPTDVAAAHAAGASDADVQLAVLIAAAFSMYNRMVDGLGARTPPTTEGYAARAGEIAENGYSAPSRLGPPPGTGDGRPEALAPVRAAGGRWSVADAIPSSGRMRLRCRRRRTMRGRTAGDATLGFGQSPPVPAARP